MNRTHLLSLVSALTLALTAGAASAAPGASGLKLASQIAGADGGWDYASFDPARRRLYVAHGDKVMTVDVATGKVNPAFAPGVRLHAAMAVPGTALVLTTNGGDSTAKLFKAATGKLVASIPTGKDADAAVYDPASGLVLVICGEPGEIDLINPKTAKSDGSIMVGGALEFAAVDGKGLAYVNMEEAAKIAVIDIKKRTVVSRYDLTDCVAPTGLALTADGRLISACSNGRAKILDAATGKELASYTIGPRPDAVLLDEVRGFAYIPSAMSGDMAVIALKGDKANTIIDTVPTALGARTGAVDLKTGRVYLPTAEYILPAPAGQRPTTKPGTFRVLVLDR